MSPSTFQVPVLRLSAILLALLLLAAPVIAQEPPPQEKVEEETGAEVEETAADADEDEEKDRKSGYKRDRGLGGPTSVAAELEEDDTLRTPAFRFPAFDKLMGPWFDWKSRVNEKNRLQLGGHYVSLYQSIDRSLTEEDDAWSGALRFFGKWTATDPDSRSTGSLAFKVEHRHRIATAVVPADLGFEAGYVGLTGLLFNGPGLVLVDLNWEQDFNQGRSGYLVGRFDPSDYMNVAGYANPFTSFQNLAVLLDASVAFPDASFGVGGGSRIGEQWYVLGSVNDANGLLTELEPFAHGAEFFSQAEIGWAASNKRNERFFKLANLTFWHVDEREHAGIESAHGALFSANWTFDNRWMPFFRAGWSEGSAPIYNRSMTLGFIRYFHDGSDLTGVGVNWGQPPDRSLREQVSAEIFYRFQISQNLALTPSVQLLLDPASNPEHDEVWLAGLRARLTF